MISLFIGSTAPYAGKSLICMGLGLRFRKAGFAISYIKPLGTLPLKVDGTLTDEDAVFIEGVLQLQQPLDLVCPVVVTQDLTISAYKDQAPNFESKVIEAHKKLSAGKDLILIGGAGNVNSGAFLGISGLRLAKRLNAKVLLVDKYDGDICIDCILGAKEALGARLVAVVLNQVSEQKFDFVQRLIKPFLRKHGIELIGVLPIDTVLNSVSVAELRTALGGETICGRDNEDWLVERFSIGAMNLEHALPYLKKIRNKAVIVGGDRPEIILAALETSTKCIILTGGLYPNEMIISKGEEKGVPMISVKEDTYTVVDRVESIMGRLHIKDRRKVERGAELVEKNLDFELLCEKLALKRPI